MGLNCRSYDGMQIYCTVDTYLCLPKGKQASRVPFRAPTELQIPRWQNDADVSSKVSAMCNDRFSKVEAQALSLHDELWLDTIRFFRNANLIYRRFDDWKGIDRFYFIPLKLQMAYCIGGHVKRMAEGPIYLGTFIKNTLEHEDLFTASCPKCGRKLHPYGYNGSPLSGRVDLEATCECGWDSYVSVSGWRIRSEALQATQKADRIRLAKFNALKPFRGSQATIKELLDWLAQVE